jgi:ubiquinone biosynthesis protein
MPGSLAMLLKAVIMMEGIGLQLDPNLDVFAITRPYARRVLTDQMSPGVLYEQTWRGTRDLSEALLALPHRLDAMLERLNEGELLVQTREEELQRVAGAIVGAANRVALALVLMALLLSIGLFAIAVNIGGWSGPVLVVLGVVGVIGVVFTGLWLMVALLRSRDV